MLFFLGLVLHTTDTFGGAAQPTSLPHRALRCHTPRPVATPVTGTRARRRHVAPLPRHGHGITHLCLLLYERVDVAQVSALLVVVKSVA